MAVVIAIDAGTTGVRAFALGDNGVPLGYSYREFGQYFPQPGWVEHDAGEILAVTQLVLAELVAKLGEVTIVALGITNQRETTVAWSRSTGQPFARAIVWQDRRTADRCADLRAAGHEQRIREITGLVTDPYFSATKMAWLFEHADVPQFRYGIRHYRHMVVVELDWWSERRGLRHGTFECIPNDVDGSRDP